jgi:L-alanine-DL-glutamate epimerase-like enolase superfamily enzyme
VTDPAPGTVPAGSASDDAVVTAVEAVPVSVPVETAYETSLSVDSGGEETYDHVVVRVETDAGVTGVGEVAPTPYWPHGLTQSACAALVEETLAPAVEGRPLHRIRRHVDRMERELAGEPFPLYGVDVALHDALGRLRGLPAYELLGGPVDGDPTIDLHYSIGIKAPDEVAAEADAAAEEGFTAFKLKVGGPDFAAERAAVAALAERVPDAAIRVDANQGWTPPEATRRIPDLDAAAGGLVLVEQPVAHDDLDGLARVSSAVDVPILADEACFSPRDVASLARRDACDAVNVKLAKTGGLVRARDVATVASAHGLPCFVGSMLELGVGAAANAAFAAASPAVAYPTGTLNVHAEHALVADRERWEPDGPRFRLPDAPGLGVSLDESALARYRVDRDRDPDTDPDPDPDGPS